MGINNECVRDILLTIEEVAVTGMAMYYPQPFERLDKYRNEEVIGCIRKCCMAGYIRQITWAKDGSGCIIYGLSPEGKAFLHEILNNEKPTCDTHTIPQKTKTRLITECMYDILKFVEEITGSGERVFYPAGSSHERLGEWHTETVMGHIRHFAIREYFDKVEWVSVSDEPNPLLENEVRMYIIYGLSDKGRKWIEEIEKNRLEYKRAKSSLLWLAYYKIKYRLKGEIIEFE